MKILIRLALNSDIEKLQKLDKWPSFNKWQQMIYCEEAIVLEIDGELVGLLRYSILWTTVPFIGLIYIKPEFQKQGYSRQMLDFLKDYLKKQGYVALLSSSQTNEPVPQAWHVRMGFSTNGIIENIDDDNVGEIVYRMLL